MASTLVFKETLSYKTPMGVDDRGVADEDRVGTLKISDLLSNDLGGAAKSFYGVDQTDPRRATMTATTAQGATITVNMTTGEISYDPKLALEGKIQTLAAGETLDDSFTYTIRMADGTLSTAKVVLTVSGMNDYVLIQSEALGSKFSGTVTEDADATASTSDSLSATGVIKFVDDDLSDTHQVGFTKTSQGDALGTFSLSPISEAANAANGSLTWSYTVDRAASQYLAAGQTVTETYAVRITDGHNEAASDGVQVITVTITGTNDAATISGTATGGVVEDGNADNNDATSQTVSGQLTVADVDQGEARLQAIAAGTAGANGHGSFEVLADGHWTYSLTNGQGAVQGLSADETLTDSIVVTSKDGTATQAINVTITGTNDAVQTRDGGLVTGQVAEDGATQFVQGTIAFTDADLRDVHTASFTKTSEGPALGVLHISPVIENATTADGAVNWNYQLDNEAAQSLGAGETVTETYAVKITDGHGGENTQVVTITVTGTNDAPYLTAVDGSDTALRPSMKRTAPCRGRPI
ncbi:RTX toxin [Rubellimicrobium mesophilum DSM 19309]|uniref:RTX toxin n=1 Tax=Rubellimicrobium mesophilum DSM 19309 TaxID=442562 RepID=A0A017HRE7_9RHOB|nr:VCBS domain-containing protein [Rubellimicrobium mesophilum]EYD76344.1 RTX toxin [Rubellimicrobium mesophilum DSM 19309]